jgi:hypothetical protein
LLHPLPLRGTTHPDSGGDGRNRVRHQLIHTAASVWRWAAGRMTNQIGHSGNLAVYGATSKKDEAAKIRSNVARLSGGARMLTLCSQFKVM